MDFREGDDFVLCLIYVKLNEMLVLAKMQSRKEKQLSLKALRLSAFARS
jgi:hypothetical protein